MLPTDPDYQYNSVKGKAVHHHAELGAGVLVHPILLHESEEITFAG